MLAVGPERSLQRKQQAGATMIEVLIAGVILAIGVLGIVTLLTISKVGSHEAIQRTRAVAMADDMIERIRRNPAGITTYDDYTLGTPLGGGSIATEPTNCTDAVCAADGLALRDVWDWEQLLDGAAASVGANPVAGLRDVRGCIRFTSDAGRNNTGIVDVILQWRGLQSSSDAVNGGAVCGPAWATADEPFRRQVVLSTYIIDEREL